MKYEKAKAEAIVLDNSDVIRTSSGCATLANRLNCGGPNYEDSNWPCLISPSDYDPGNPEEPGVGPID